MRSRFALSFLPDFDCEPKPPRAFQGTHSHESGIACSSAYPQSAILILLSSPRPIAHSRTAWATERLSFAYRSPVRLAVSA